MKTIIQLILLVLFFNISGAFAIDGDVPRKVGDEFSIEEPSISAESGSLRIVFSKLSKEIAPIYRVYIFENNNGDEIVRFEQTKEYDDQIADVKIDKADYRLNSTTQAFAVRLIMERNRSGAYGYGRETLNLFVYEGEIMRQVLDEFVVSEDNKYEMFGGCVGAWNESKTILIMSNKKTNGYNNITTKTRGEGHGYDGIDEKTGECKEIVTPIKSSGTLKFDGKKYNMSK